MSASKISKHLVVVFEETGKRRKVVRDCLVCSHSPEPYGHDIISPSGIAHVGGEGGVTYCGRDATRDNWWWPL